jgi:hypothetical protein
MLGTSFATLINQKVLLPSPRTQYIAVDKDHLIDIMKPVVTKIRFDEDWYLKNNPDIAAGIEAGKVASAAAHFICFGYYEHRMPYPIEVDEGWYLAQYPDVQDAVAKGVIENARNHFYAVGYREGRLPFANFALDTAS